MRSSRSTRRSPPPASARTSHPRYSSSCRTPSGSAGTSRRARGGGSAPRARPKLACDWTEGEADMLEARIAVDRGDLGRAETLARAAVADAERRHDLPVARARPHGARARATGTPPRGGGRSRPRSTRNDPSAEIEARAALVRLLEGAGGAAEAEAVRSAGRRWPSASPSAAGELRASFLARPDVRFLRRRDRGAQRPSRGLLSSGAHVRPERRSAPRLRALRPAVHSPEATPGRRPRPLRRHHELPRRGAERAPRRARGEPPGRPLRPRLRPRLGGRDRDAAARPAGSAARSRA